MRGSSIHLATMAGLWLCTFVYVARADVEQRDFASHPPTRPLPAPSDRAMPNGSAFFVDPVEGNNDHPGDKSEPWKTLAHAVGRLKPGDTLYLRDGTYFEHVLVSCTGTAEKPITIRSYPGELATINGGIPEFVTNAATAWEPCPGGVEGEFRSVRTYPELGGAGVAVLGNFADSMVPLQGYRYLADLRDDSMVWDVTEKVGDDEGVYCGPGIYYDPQSGYLHARLAPTNLKALGNDNYRGETDSRKLPLIIAGANAGAALVVRDAKHLRVEDLVVCGARTATVEVSDCEDVTFDGVTAFGGATPFQVRGTTGLRLYHTACRGIAAPWTFRGHLKYRSIEARIFSASGWTPGSRENRDFELAYSEFTDCVDGVFIGNVKNVHFHHNLLDNVSDDGMFLTAGTAYDGTTHGGDHYIYQNYVARCLTAFAFGVGHGRQKMTVAGRQTGSGVWIYRNVFDFRRPVHYHLPAPDEPQITSHGRMTGDHGSPTWEPMNIYHNTIVENVPMRRVYYLSDLAGSLAGGSKRRLLNNIAVQANGMPGRQLPPVILPPEKLAAAQEAPPKPDPLADLIDNEALVDKSTKKGGAATSFSTKVDPKVVDELKRAAQRKPSPPLPVDLQADGNLHWGYAAKPDGETFFSDFRQSDEFNASKHWYPSGWTAHDVVSDPRFPAFSGDWRQPIDVRLEPDSPAVNHGVEIPGSWPDPLRSADRGAPDIGALPLAAAPCRVGVRGRLTILGAAAQSAAAPQFDPIAFPQRPERGPITTHKPAAVVQGYPAPDGDLIRFALAKRDVPVEMFDKAWLDTNQYENYRLIVIVGDLVRARMTPHQYGAADISRVAAFLQSGGTLFLMRAGRGVFNSQEGRAALDQIAGTARRLEEVDLRVRLPDHPWLEHLDPRREHPWATAHTASSMRHSRGEAIIGSEKGEYASLLRIKVGQGQLIYLGWDVSSSLPHGRQSSTVEKERAYEEQINLLENIVGDVYP